MRRHPRTSAQADLSRCRPGGAPPGRQEKVKDRSLDTHDVDEHGWRYRMGRFLLAVTVLLTVFTVLRWFDAAHTVVAAAQGARPVWGLMAGLVLVAALFTRRRAAIVAAALLVAVHAWLTGAWFIPADTAEPAEDDLTVMVSNLEFGNAEPSSLAQRARQLDADVLVLLEVTPQALGAVQGTELGALLPHRGGQPDLGAAGTVVLSRYPVTQVARGTGSMHQPLVSLATGKGEVLLKAAHPMPPTSALTWHRELRNLDRAVADLVATDPRPVIVAGDFNATEDHPVFRPLTRTAVDAHRVAGAGWVRTWPQEAAIPRFAHIDHVLTHGLAVVDAGSVPVPGTDHAAVWARLSLPAVPAADPAPTP